VDRIQSRLALATSFGASHVIDTSKPDLKLVDEIGAFTDNDGSTITVDTTSVLKLVENAMDFTCRRGKVFFIGAADREAALSVNLVSMYRVNIRVVHVLESLR